MDELQNSGKITIACSQIILMANQINHLRINRAMVPGLESDQRDYDDILKYTSKSVIEIMNELADFMDARDALTLLDVQLFNPIFEELNKGGR